MSSNTFSNLENSKLNGNLILTNGYIQFPNGSQQTEAGGAGGGNVSTNTINTYTNTSINNFEDSEITCATQDSQDNSYLVANTSFVQTVAQNVGQLPNNCTGIGDAALQNATGSNNCAFGLGTLPNVTADLNCAFGFESLNECTTGSNNCAVGDQTLISCTSGAFNVAIGSECLYGITTGDSNLGIGAQAATSLTTSSNNTCVGNQSGSNLVGNNNNTLLGSKSGPINGDTNTYNYLTCIGAGSTPVVVGGSNQLVLGSITGNETVYIPGGNIVLGNNQTTSPTFTFTLQPTFTDLLFVGSGSSGIPSTFLDLSQPETTMSSSQFVINSVITTFNGNVSIPAPNNLTINQLFTNNVELINQGADPPYTTNGVLYLNTTSPSTQQLRVNINGTLYYINLIPV